MGPRCYNRDMSEKENTNEPINSHELVNSHDIERSPNPKIVKPWDMLNPNEPRSSKELSEDRIDICKGTNTGVACEFFNPITVGCNKCGCFLKMKTKLYNAVCPIGKW